MISYIDYSEERHKPVRRRPIQVSDDPYAQNFARMLGVPEMLPGQGDDGYGAKITTEREVRIGSRWHRVYATCYGNSASCWIMKQGKQFHLR